MASLLIQSFLGFMFLFLALYMQCFSANLSVPIEFESTEDAATRIEKTPRIVNGDTAKKNRYPFIVSIHKISSIYGAHHICGASVYDQFRVITAAHCVDNATADELLLIFGEFHFQTYEGDEEYRNVTSILMHAEYNPSARWVNDIAILTLEEPLNFTKSIQPICLTHKPAVPGEQTYVMGWGDTKETADNNFLQVIMLPIVAQEQCNHIDWMNNTIVNGMICAGREEGGTNTCQGDSGGPLVRETNDGFELIGVVSWGPVGCIKKRKPAVFADVFYYLDWIDANAGKPDYGNETDIECHESNLLGPGGEVSFSPNFALGEEILFMVLIFQIYMLWIKEPKTTPEQKRPLSNELLRCVLQKFCWLNEVRKGNFWFDLIFFPRKSFYSFNL